VTGPSRVDRSLLLERDPGVYGTGVPLESIKDATWEHQRHAMTHGYNSLVEMAVDELAGQVRELKARVDALERMGVQGGVLRGEVT
jgi:hypothetical protein